MVNFQDILHACLSYGHSLRKAAPTLPYPIKVHSPYTVDDYGVSQAGFSLIENISLVHEKLAYEG